MIIDDSELSRDFMLDLLAEAGIPAIGAPTALGAVQTVLEEGISVVITDVNMPEMRGPELVRAFRSEPNAAHVRILFVSALPLRELQELISTVHVDGIIEKDQIEVDLVPTIKSLLANLAREKTLHLPGYA